MQKIEVVFYDKPDGSSPVKEFLLELDVKMRAKMLRTISMLEEFGHELREPYSKHLDDGIFELQAKISTDITRTLYFFIKGNKAILTNGFVKKTQKTPISELELAKKYRAEYLHREV